MWDFCYHILMAQKIQKKQGGLPISEVQTIPSVLSVEERLANIESTLAGQQKILKQVYDDAEKTRSYIFWGRVISLFYLIIVIGPIILAAIYLPPYIKEMTSIFGTPSPQEEGGTARRLQEVLRGLR